MYIKHIMPIYDKSMKIPQTADAAARELDLIRAALDRSAIVAVTDAKGTIIHVNDKFCEISKYSRNELIGQNHRIVNSGYHPAEFFMNMWKTISSGHVWENEVKNRAKDDTFYWVYTTIVPFLDEQNKPYQYVSIRYEITQTKKAEEKLQEYARRLEESNRELQDFASVAAHDLQEPLRKILTFSDRLLSKPSSHLSPEGSDYIKRMSSAALRMRTLIDDLLSYSRVHTKKQPFSSVDMNTVLSGVISDLEIRIEQTSAKIETQNLPTIEADPSQMRQMLQNLLSNALKFHKPHKNPMIKISGSQNGEMCEIQVHDQGIGFDEKYLDRIFTIFQRLHGREAYEGTGVGLAIVRRIVDRHHGSITAKSSPDHGACFIIRLPVKQRGENFS